jgi:hypothetical protein
MCPTQVLNIFNVAYLLLKSVLFNRNKLRCDVCGFLREILLEISLKKIIFFLKKKKRTKIKKKKIIGVADRRSSGKLPRGQ